MLGATHRDSEHNNNDVSRPSAGGKETQSSAHLFRGDCGKCGAKRIDSQIGLEKTPEEYVAKMVEVFREVRRVLRKDGTLWLNLGDTYSSGGRETQTRDTFRDLGSKRPKQDLPGTDHCGACRDSKELQTERPCWYPVDGSFRVTIRRLVSTQRHYMVRTPNPMPESVIGQG